VRVYCTELLIASKILKMKSYSSMILPVVLYGYELGLHPREEQREIERV
jgi:hypothetical protein